MATTTPQRASLLGLPRELRDNIYAHIHASVPTADWYRRPTPFPGLNSPNSSHAAMTLVCRAISIEICEAYAANTFWNLDAEKSEYAVGSIREVDRRIARLAKKVRVELFRSGWVNRRESLAVTFERELSGAGYRLVWEHLDLSDEYTHQLRNMVTDEGYQGTVASIERVFAEMVAERMRVDGHAGIIMEGLARVMEAVGWEENVGPS